MTDDERVRHALYPLFNDGLIPSYDDVSVGHLAELAAKELAALRACADPPEEPREEQDLSAILQSVLTMIGLPGFDARWFDAHGDWDFGQLRAHGLDAKLAEIRAALRACAEAPETPADLFPIKLDAAVAMLEALQADGIYLHDSTGDSLTGDAFIAAVTKALSRIERACAEARPSTEKVQEDDQFRALQLAQGKRRQEK